MAWLRSDNTVPASSSSPTAVAAEAVECSGTQTESSEWTESATQYAEQLFRYLSNCLYLHVQRSPLIHFENSTLRKNVIDSAVVQSEADTCCYSRNHHQKCFYYLLKFNTIDVGGTVWPLLLYCMNEIESSLSLSITGLSPLDMYCTLHSHL